MKNMFKKYIMTVPVFAVQITKRNVKKLETLCGYDFDKGLIKENIGCWLIQDRSGIEIYPEDIQLQEEK